MQHERHEHTQHPPASPTDARHAYEAPRLTAHGTVESLTLAAGLLLSDALLVGSVV